MGSRKAELGAVLAALLVLGGTEARAQECREAPLIRDLAQDILAHRDELGRFEVRRYGATEAYLAWHYDALDRPTMQALLAELLDAKVREADTLAATFSVSQGGLADALALFDPDPSVALALSGMAVWRMLLLQDAGTSFFRLAARMPQTTATGIFHAQMIQGQNVPFLIADQPEDFRRAVAAAAEAEGFVVTAAAVLADLESLDDYTAFIAKHAGAEGIDRAQAPWVHYMGSGLRHREAPIPNDPARDPEVLAGHLTNFQVMRAGMREEAAPILGIVFNQTGETEVIPQVAGAFVAALDAATIRPVTVPEEGWLFLDAALSEGLGDRWAMALRGFDWPSRNVRHYAGRAAETVDIVRARATLAPVLGGTAVPEPLGLRGETLDWAVWVGVAQRLATDPAALPKRVEERVPTVELLTAIGRYDLAIAAARHGTEPEERLRIEHDLIQRMDRLCDGWTAFPGQATMLGGLVMFRF